MFNYYNIPKRKKKKSKYFDIWLKRSYYFSQVVIAFVAVYGLFCVVVPVYNAVIKNDIKIDELEKSKNDFSNKNNVLENKSSINSKLVSDSEKVNRQNNLKYFTNRITLLYIDYERKIATYEMFTKPDNIKSIKINFNYKTYTLEGIKYAINNAFSEKDNNNNELMGIPNNVLNKIKKYYLNEFGKYKEIKNNKDFNSVKILCEEKSSYFEKFKNENKSEHIDLSKINRDEIDKFTLFRASNYGELSTQLLFEFNEILDFNKQIIFGKIDDITKKLFEDEQYWNSLIN
jgi:hypothetical protein